MKLVLARAGGHRRSAGAHRAPARRVPPGAARPRRSRATATRGAAALLIEGAALHLEADLKWLALCEERRRSRSESDPVAKGHERLCGTRPAAVAALRGIDLAVAEGEFVSVMGPFGCGKSTLLHLLGGLDRPTAGEVHLGGRRVDELSARRRGRACAGREVGFVFEFFNLIANLTVADNVELPGLLAGLSPREARAAARELLDDLGIAELAGSVARRVCPVVSSSASRSRARSSTARDAARRRADGRTSRQPERARSSRCCARPPRAGADDRARHPRRARGRAADRVIHMRDGADLRGDAAQSGDRDPGALASQMLRLEV